MLLYALLGFLRYAPMSGYDLEQFINVSINHFWNAKLSQIYRTLKKMEQDGLVASEMQEQDGARSKRVYFITQAGIDMFEEWLAETDAELDEMKQPFLVRTFFIGSEDVPDVNKQLDLWRALHTQQLRYYQEILPEHIQKLMQEFSIEKTEKERFFWLATLKFGVMYERMILQWLDEIQSDFGDLSD